MLHAPVFQSLCVYRYTDKAFSRTQPGANLFWDCRKVNWFAAWVLLAVRDRRRARWWTHNGNSDAWWSKMSGQKYRPSHDETNKACVCAMHHRANVLGTTRHTPAGYYRSLIETFPCQTRSFTGSIVAFGNGRHWSNGIGTRHSHLVCLPTHHLIIIHLSIATSQIRFHLASHRCLAQLSSSDNAHLNNKLRAN